MPAAMESLADLLDRLGNVPPQRVLLIPPPGKATEVDLLAALSWPRKRICELIDGTLVEKAVGFRESLLAAWLIQILGDFVRPLNLGVVTGEQGMMRLTAGRVRIPDVAFTSWDRLPGRRIPVAPIPDLAPDLAVEVLSDSNTAAEMLMKRQDFFAAGTALVWEIDPDARTVAVFTAQSAPARVLSETDTLSGSPVLPGFSLPLADLFAELDRHG